MKYREYKDPQYAKLAEEILTLWEENKIFEKSVSEREGNPAFTFYEGPPSANGIPGIHHVMARTVKDIFCRFKTLKGFQVKRKGGWDAHGLPVELQVEKELGITKEDIGTNRSSGKAAISVEQYNRKCREAVMKYKHQWDDLTEKMGYWVDLDDPYITFEVGYMESVWSLLKKFYDKGLLYKGFTIQPYSPAAGTGLSSHELNQPGTYRDVRDTTAVAQFKIEGTESDYILAWTTTPWTLAANSALAVGRGITYIKVDTWNPYTFQRQTVILAKDRFVAYFNSKAIDIPIDAYKAGDKLIPFNVVEELKGSDLIGLKYEQLLPYVIPDGKAFEVIEADFVSTTDGTGIVHISPTFGADDFSAAQKAGIVSILVKDEEDKDVPIVDKQGRYVKEMGEFAGMYVKNEYYGAKPPDKSLDVLISIRLKEENKAFKIEKYEHSYPHCWRTDKPVLYYPLDSWFIKTTAFKDRLTALNKTINWKPESTGTGRFGHWLENLVDWNLSRSRYWGTPLPIWVSEDRKEEICIGSIAELKSEVEKSIKAGFMNDPVGDDFDLHRPYVDGIVLVSATGQKLIREPDLVDVWFDSGAMPYAQWHYPFENEAVFKENYPADFIAEGVDQTRGWFFTLHTISVMLFDQVAFKNVIANGLVLDQKGNKMSKRSGNTIDPFTTIATYGPDATRWYMISNANPWDNLKFNIEGVTEVQRRFFGTLHNTYSFFAMYANLDQFDYKGVDIALSNRPDSDRWILSRLNSLIRQVEEAYQQYEPSRVAKLIQDFTIDDMSNWYVRLNRKRFWKPALLSESEYYGDKTAAYQTLYTCLNTIAKLGSPIAPFYMDRLFNDLNDGSGKETAISIHLTDFPKVDEDAVDTSLEKQMELAQNISSLAHSLRKKEKLRVRQPLSKILIPVLDKKFKQHVQAVEHLIRTEVNVKAVEYIDNASAILVKKIRPNFRKLGRKYGRQMKDVATKINTFGQEEISQMERNNQINVILDSGEITLTPDEVEISFEDIPGWLVVSEGKLTVALDITLTEELQKEGIARDLVNGIQNLRKDIGLEVQDKISIGIVSNTQIVNAAIEANRAYICRETQALSLEIVAEVADGELLEVNKYKIEIKIQP